MVYSVKAENNFELPVIQPQELVSPDEVQKADRYGEHAPENVEDMIREERLREAAEQVLAANAAAFEKAKSLWHATFFQRLKTLGLDIEGISELSLNSETYSFLHRNEYVSPTENQFSCNLGVEARAGYQGSFVQRTGQVQIHNGELWEHEFIWASPGGKGQENFTDIVMRVKEDKPAGVTLRAYIPHPEFTEDRFRTVKTYEIDYDSRGRLVRITPYAVTPRSENNFPYSTYTKCTFRENDDFNGVREAAEKELGEMFGIPDYHLPDVIDVPATVSRSAEGYIKGQKFPTFVEKNQEAEKIQ